MFSEYQPKEVEDLGEASYNVIFENEGFFPKVINDLKAGKPLDEH